MKAPAHVRVPDRVSGLALAAGAGGAAVRPFREWQALLPALVWAYAGRVGAQVRHSLEMRTQRMTAWLITRGRVRLVSDDTVLTVRRGEWVFFCGRFQKHDFSPAAELVSVSLRVPADGEAVWRHAPFVVKAARHPELERAARALIDLVEAHAPTAMAGLAHRAMPPAEAARIGARALEWAAVCMEVRRVAGVTSEEERAGEGAGGKAGGRRRGHPKVARALERLTEAPLHERYAVARLAGEVGLSPGHLEQLFVRELGTTPRRLREHYRRSEAGYRVRHSDVSLKQIAWELGFCSASHFSNWFRRVFGQSPRAWRRG
ncbi:MAG: AraC family transcriptional regulator [Opitutaceae bacterium]|jgi:AraC-like DNA-binding protein|nr:AraC family transcriptional regulator [Opitutaceae bacterium]